MDFTILLIIAGRPPLPITFLGRGAPLIRDRRRLRVRNDPGSAAHHSALSRFVLRCARET
jgi:hypothetical protein